MTGCSVYCILSYFKENNLPGSSINVFYLL